MDKVAPKNSDNMGRSSLKLNSDIKDHEEISGPTIRIDDVFADSGDPILLIKIDTQGTEFQVLESGACTMEKFRPVIIFELEDRYFPDEERITIKKALKEFFNNLDYSLFSISKDLNCYPKIDVTQNYHGDIFAVLT
tara:strand:- start:653 stop:1063 length:411 start_codon:yes stop_codon:yes gene_type:complete